MSSGAKEIVLEEMPDAYVTLSSEVANVMREYERFSTAAMNCYVGPKTAFYLDDLELETARAPASLEASHHAVERRRLDRGGLRLASRSAS